MSKDESVVIPHTVKEFVNNYPDLARDIATRTSVRDYNSIRETVKLKYGDLLVNWMDTSGIVKKTKTILHYLNELGHDSINN